MFVIKTEAKTAYFVKMNLIPTQKNTKNIGLTKIESFFFQQREAYDKLFPLISSSTEIGILATNCDREFDEKSDKLYNGWNYKDLSASLNTLEYQDIMVPIQIKLKVAYKEKVNVTCVDDVGLIKEEDLEYSNLKAFKGFLDRLLESMDVELVKFKRYSKALLLDEKDKNQDPILLAKNRIKDSIAKIEEIKLLKNKNMISALDKIKEDNIVIIITNDYDQKILENKIENLKYVIQKVPVTEIKNDNEQILETAKNLR